MRELLDRRPREGPRLPAWIERLASVGIVSPNPEIIRRQRFTNVVAYAIAGNAASHLIINLIHDVHGLLPAHVYNAVIAGLMLSMHRLHRFGENLAANTLLAIAVTGNLLVVWMFGKGSGLHVYFTLAGVVLFMLGIQHWHQFLFWFLTMATALIVSLRLAPEYGLLVPQDFDLRNMIASHAMINAIMINMLIIVYALVALRRAEVELEEQREKSDALVRIVFPTTIARRLLTGKEHRIADQMDDLSILFADLVGFSGAARNQGPVDVIDYLDDFVAQELVDAAKHGTKILAGPLRLGVIPTLGPYLLPRILPPLQKRYPELRLELRETQTKPMLEELIRGTLDAVMLAMPVELSEIESLPLFEDRFLLAVPSGDPLRKRSQISPGEFDPRRLLLLEEGHCLRDQALAYCGLPRAAGSPALGATSLATVMQMVASGYGITLVPEVAVDAETGDRRIKLIRFAKPQPSRMIGLAWRRTSPRKADFTALGEVVKSALSRKRRRK